MSRRCYAVEVMDNSELLRKIKADEPGAFDELVDRYGDRILGFGMKMCGEREDARDVFQDTLMQAYRSLKKLEKPEALRSWLFRVAANACLMKRRKGKYEPVREISLEELKPDRSSLHETEIPDAGSLPEDEVSRGQIRSKVREAISEIPPHYRIVLLLRDMEHFSTREVATMLDLPESTIKMRLHRGRLMVRERLEDTFGHGGVAV